jgi:sugar O-acyltransferase (sialic acid O-acetyltransferase NeuD family)
MRRRVLKSMRILDRKLLGVYGAGGLGKEVLSLIVSSQTNLDPNEYEVCFIDDLSITGTREVQVFNQEEFFSKKFDFYGFVLAVSDPKQRANLSLEMERRGGVPLTIIATSVIRIGRNQCGRGSILFPGTVISNDTVIGDFSIVNAQSYVGHDVEIGDFVTISPGTTICGNVVLEDQVFVGAGASIMPGNPSKKLRIGRNSVIGLGATVIIDTAKNSVVAGNPARRILENPDATNN